jgi:hypothetical protein
MTKVSNRRAKIFFAIIEKSLIEIWSLEFGYCLDIEIWSLGFLTLALLVLARPG